MLDVKNIYKTYSINQESQVIANKNINFTIEDKTMVWISGATGSGKTTLLNMLSAIDTPDKGSIWWDQYHISSMTDKERAEFRLKNMGLIFQSLELIKAQNSYNNVALPLRYAGVPENKVKKLVYDIFEYLEIESLINKSPMQMSGGQQQRVALARALVHKPKFVLGDEVSSALDSSTADTIYNKIQDYIQKNRCIGIFISHDPTIKKHVNKIFHMKDGELEETV